MGVATPRGFRGARAPLPGGAVGRRLERLADDGGARLVRGFRARRPSDVVLRAGRAEMVAARSLDPFGALPGARERSLRAVAGRWAGRLPYDRRSDLPRTA